MNLSATPDSLFRFSRISSWGLAPHCLGLPVLTAFILCSHPLTNTPAALEPAGVARFSSRRRPSSCFNRLGVRIALFEACSVFILLLEAASSLIRLGGPLASRAPCRAVTSPPRLDCFRLEQHLPGGIASSHWIYAPFPRRTKTLGCSV